MTSAAIRQFVIAVGAAALLTACVEGASPGSDGSTGGSILPPTDAPPPRRGGNQDIEAPEIFQVTDTALWDGRPSLGGIWVASPDTKDPERVVMVNPSTGKTVTGALFRRERDNPGPTLQISSDAAEALGILAGQPAEIRVTALRKAEADVPAVAEPQVTADAEAAATDGAAASEATAIATAALAAVDAGADATADAATADTPSAAPPRKLTWKERRAEARAAREAAKAEAAAATAGVTEAGDATTGAAETAVSDAAVVSPVETAPLDARSADVTGPAAGTRPEKRKTRRQIRAEAAAAAAAATTESPPGAEATATARPIQIASFSTQDSANRAIEALLKVGVTASARQSETSGKVVWGVIAMGDETLLASIVKAGFADAFFLK